MLTPKEPHIPKDQTLKACDYANAVFEEDANFKGKIFDCFADFSGATFKSAVDFSEAVFHDGASFKGAKFICNGNGVLFDNAVFLPSEYGHDVDFSEAQFGLPYTRDFGGWRIGFEIDEYEKFNLLRFKQEENGPAKHEKLKDIQQEGSLHTFLQAWNLEEHAENIASSFKTFRNNPKTVSFANCRFGDMDFPDLTEKEVQEIGDKESQRLAKLIVWRDKEENGILEQRLQVFKNHYLNNENPDALENITERMSVAQVLASHLSRERITRKGEKGNVNFSKTQFFNQGQVDFFNTLFVNARWVNFHSVSFNNGEGVSFNSARFNNGQRVDFRSAHFRNAGSITFHSTNFSNGEGVTFNSARFRNAGSVTFNSASFRNIDLSFAFALFSNGIDVNFKSASFSNEGWLTFDSARFRNAGSVTFNSASFRTAGMVSFESAKFNNREFVSFFSANFSNREWVSFKSANFNPQKGVNFQQVIWAQNGSLIFNHVIFAESFNIKFNECLFLPQRNIEFLNPQLPEKGSLMFQRCFFSTQATVNFTGAFFRHTTFEGGPISWLKDKEGDDRKPQAILKERLGQQYENVPQEVRQRIEGLPEIPEFSLVFSDDTKVLWKDLTTESAKNLTFRNTNFSKSLFDGMTLSHIQLNAPHWRERWGRKILFEEEKLLLEGKTSFIAWLLNDWQLRTDKNGPFLSRLQGEWNKRRADQKSLIALLRHEWKLFRKGKKPTVVELRNIENQYTQLKNNLELKGAYQQAGHFHQSEQEVRQKILLREPGISNIFVWFFGFLYKWSSGYGEKPVRTLIVTLSLAFGLTWFNSVTKGSADVEASSVFFEAMVQTFSPFSWKAILEEAVITADNVWRYYVYFTGQVLLLGIMVPLLVMTVRRYFKR